MLTYIVGVSILFLRKENDMVDKREKLMNSFNQYGFLTFKQVIDKKFTLQNPIKKWLQKEKSMLKKKGYIA